MFFVLDGPGYGPIAGLDAQAARSDGNQTDCHVELTLCARFCMQQSVQCLIPVHLMSTERPVWRESDFRSEERRVGKGVDLRGRRIIKTEKRVYDFKYEDRRVTKEVGLCTH